jgi:hypothetical protein
MSTAPADNDNSLVLRYFVAKLRQIGARATVSCLYWHLIYTCELYRITVHVKKARGQDTP